LRWDRKRRLENQEREERKLDILLRDVKNDREDN
jgi:hypothetical protein